MKIKLDKDVFYLLISTLTVVLCFSILKIYSDTSEISNVDFNSLKIQEVETNIDPSVIEAIR